MQFNIKVEATVNEGYRGIGERVGIERGER